MCDVREIFKEEDTYTWLKCCLAIKFARDGIIEFVKREIDSFRQDTLKYITSVNPGASSVCTECTTQSTLKCPTYGICQRGKKNDPCKYHTTGYKPCPNRICLDFNKRIEREHRHKSPSWKNTDAKGWCTNWWDVAKCYLPPDGYSDVTSVSEADFNALINIVINCKHFDNRFKADLKRKSNICIKVRKIGRDVRHNADCKIRTDFFNQSIDDLLEFLNDDVCLKNDPNSILAQGKLEKLKKSTYTITTDDIDAVRKNALAIKEVKLEIEQVTLASKDELNNETKSGVEQVKNAAQTSIAKIESTSESGADVLNRTAMSVIANVESTTQSGVNEIKSTTQSGLEQIIQCLEDAKAKLIRYESETIEQQKINTRQEGFRGYLIKFYQVRHSATPLSPLMTNIDDKLSKFYNPQKLSIIKPGEKQTPISFKDMFKDGYKNIYIQGHAGIGKSTLCRHLILQWCTFQSNLGESDNIRTRVAKIGSEDITKFDFLFFIDLREAFGFDCEIEEMIKNQIVSQLRSGDRYDADFVGKILDQKRCLIILDGLDEWSHPENITSPCRQSPKSIPHRKLWEQCTYLTTTRPSKLSTIKLKDSEKDILLSLDGIEDPHELIRTVVDCLNVKFKTSRDAQNFEDQMEEMNIINFLDIPVMLMHLICLWYDRQSIGESKCEIQSNVIDMMFGRDHEKLQGDSSQTELELPSCFDETEHCSDHTGFIMSLSKLAFHSLIIGCRKDSSSVIKNEVLCKYLTKSQKQSAKTMGILEEYESKQRLTRPILTYNFIHKSFQEFLAAVYIATNQTDMKDIDALFEVFGISVYLLDISDLFVFVCGLCPEKSLEMSKRIAHRLYIDVFYLDVHSIRNIVHDYQDIVLEGSLERVNKGVHPTELTLLHAVQIDDLDDAYSDEGQLFIQQLLQVNEEKLLTYCIADTKQVGELQDLVTRFGRLSDLVLLNIENTNVSTLDLSRCRNLVRLHLHNVQNMNISIHENLLQLHMAGCPQDLQDKILLTLSNAAPRLTHLTVLDCVHPHLLLKSLAVAPQLRYIHIGVTHFEDHDVLIPKSVSQLTFRQVYMTSRACRQVIETLEEIEHPVECAFLYCTDTPDEEIRQEIGSKKELFEVIEDQVNEKNKWGRTFVFKSIPKVRQF